MQAGTALMGRRFLAAVVAALLMASVMFLLADTPARASHINPTGPIGPNCVEFQAGATGTKSPTDYPGVDITLSQWTNSNHGFDFTISGLAANEYVDISVKYGNSVEEMGPYGNGSHSYSNSYQNAISHVRLCVFEGEETTTTTQVEETTTTQVEETTTTTQPEVTTTTTVPEETTTTTVETTTPTDEVLPTVITTTTTVASSSSSVEDEVEDTEVLPFTGGNNDMLALLAGGLGLLGALVLAGTRRMEDN